MLLKWHNKDGRKREAKIESIDDLACYEDDGTYGLRLRDGISISGGILGIFKSKDSRDEAYNDIKEAIEEGCEDFLFRPSFYERVCD